MIKIAGKIRTRVREKTPYRTGDKKRNRRFILRGSIPFAERTSMPEISPHCGKESGEISPRFCNGCGARMDGTPPNEFPGFPTPLQEWKNSTIAGVCSSVLPGLGQVYNGETAKMYTFFLLAVVGLFFLVIPGFLVRLYAMYDAYAIAGKMNSGEIEFREMQLLYMILFVIFAGILIIVILTILITLIMGSLMTQLGPHGKTDYSWMFGKNRIF